MKKKEFDVTVHVSRKPAVLNPEERPVLHGLHDLGFKGVSRISMGRCFILTIEASDEADAKRQTEEMCNKLLINLVVEVFEIVSAVEVTS